jgi:hypothetical protein
VAIEESAIAIGWRAKHDKDIAAAAVPVQLKEALRERQLPLFNLVSNANPESDRPGAVACIVRAVGSMCASVLSDAVLQRQTSEE